MPAPVDGGIVSSKEQHCFEYFYSRTSRKLPGAFTSAFWNRLVIQASSTEPAVLYAMLALGAAHKRESAFRYQFSSRQLAAPDQDEQLLLRSYSKSIGHLQRDVLAGDRESLRVALLACLLFACMEYLRGHYQSGNLHLQNGAKLIGELKIVDAASPSPGKPPPNFVDYWIAETFTRLCVQSALLGQVPAGLCMALPDLDADMTPPVFYSANQARHILDKLVGMTIDLSERSRALQPASDGSSPLSELVEEQRAIQQTLLSWHHTYESSIDCFQHEKSLMDALALKMLRPFHIMAQIMADTCLRDSESVYYHQLPRFISVTQFSEEMFKIAREKNHHPIEGYGEEGSRSISDIGVIAPLYYTALKCRDHGVRARVVKLFRNLDHKEGIWNSEIVSCIVEEVMRLEERDFFQPFNLDDNKPLVYCSPVEAHVSLPLLPEANMFHHVQVTLPNGHPKTLVLECWRRQGDEISIGLTREFDSATQKWHNRL